MPRITINGITIDPTAQSHALAAASLIAPDASSSDYLLIQTRQPIDGAQRQALKNLDVEVLEYVPESTYICHYRPADLNKIRALPFVEWANIYMKGFKIAPALLTTAGELKTANLMSVHNTPPDILSRQPRLVLCHG
jgi:serine protease AprX